MVRLVLLALLALVSAIVSVRNGTGIPASPPVGSRALVEFEVRAGCLGVKRFAADAGAFDCQPGESERAVVQVIVRPDAGVPAGPNDIGIPDDLDVIKGSVRFPPLARAVRPGKSVTTIPPYDAECLVGEWRTDAGSAWDGRWQTAWCCRAGCACAGRCKSAPSVIHAGTENATVRRMLAGLGVDGGS